MSLHIGAATVDRVEEQQFSVPFLVFTEDDAFIERRVRPLPSGFLGPETMTFQFTCQSWIVRVEGLTVLVDPCNGNGRARAVPNFNDSAFPYLERLAAKGVLPESVDVVFCTHMHNDHCGWNTQQVDGHWVPTFANAEYLFVDVEYRRWDTIGAKRHPNAFNESVFDECIRPVVDAAQARIVTAPHELTSSLTIELGPGHTEGHAILRLESEGVLAYFTGDVLHHPVQITRPELHLPGCDDLARAIATRRSLVGRIHHEHAFLFPAHFAAPHYGLVDTDHDEYLYRPGGATGQLEENHDE